MEDISESLIDETPSNNSSNVIPYDPRRRYEELLEQVERLGHFKNVFLLIHRNLNQKYHLQPVGSYSL